MLVIISCTGIIFMLVYTSSLYHILKYTYGIYHWYKEVMKRMVFDEPAKENSEKEWTNRYSKEYWITWYLQ
jgi:hypothetical protein